MCVPVWCASSRVAQLSAAPPTAAPGGHVRLVVQETPTDLHPPLPFTYCTHSLQTVARGSGYVAILYFLCKINSSCVNEFIIQEFTALIKW